MNTILNIEFHKPMSGFVTISKGSKKLILPMNEWDKLPADPNKRNKQLDKMLYGTK